MRAQDKILRTQPIAQQPVYVPRYSRRQPSVSFSLPAGREPERGARPFAKFSARRIICCTRRVIGRRQLVDLVVRM
jgi:hypothetical protein